MTAMKITLSQQAAPEIWGKNALLSVNDAGFIVHNPKNDLATVQKAARKIKNQGILNVALAGDGWNLEECWAFHQGFNSVKNQGSVEYPNLGEQQAEFDNRVKCATFVCELINEPSESLTPEKLAQQAVEFIQNIAKPNTVSYEIIRGEELKEQGYHGIWAVGKGSINPPALLKLDFNPTGDENAPVLACLVGKGITFDTGGYSLKPSDGMSTMRTDMGGAALVSGALAFAISRG